MFYRKIIWQQTIGKPIEGGGKKTSFEDFTEPGQSPQAQKN